MTIYDFDKIDMIGKTDDGLKLVIVDPANLVDEDRLYSLHRKLRVYEAAIDNPDFRSEYPGWENIQIQVTVAAAPTEAMKKVDSCTFEVDGKKYKVPITYEFVEAPFGSPEDEKMHLIDVNYNYKTISDKIINLATEHIKMGAFTAFGLSWNSDGKSKVIDSSLSEPEDQIPLVKQGIQDSISEDSSVQTVAVAYDVLAIHPDQTEKSDAIAIELEHRLGNPLTMLVHYKQQGDKVETLEPYAMQKELEFFSDADLEQSGVAAASDPSGEDNGTSDAELQSWLESLPTICFLLVSGIDGNIDKKETNAFANAVQEYSGHKNPLVREVFTAAAGRFEKDMTEIMGMGESGGLLMPMRIALSRQTALKKAPEHAEEFFNVLLEMSTAIANASGGVFGFGSKISKEEAAALKVIESMLSGSDSDE